MKNEKKYKNLKSFKMSPIDLSNTHQIPIRTYDDESIRLISHRFHRSMSPKCIKPNQYISCKASRQICTTHNFEYF